MDGLCDPRRGAEMPSIDWIAPANNHVLTSKTKWQGDGIGMIRGKKPVLVRCGGAESLSPEKVQRGWFCIVLAQVSLSLFLEIRVTWI